MYVSKKIILESSEELDSEELDGDVALGMCLHINKQRIKGSSRIGEVVVELFVVGKSSEGGIRIDKVGRKCFQIG